jgi:hypothetical protein
VHKMPEHFIGFPPLCHAGTENDGRDLIGAAIIKGQR